MRIALTLFVGLLLSSARFGVADNELDAEFDSKVARPAYTDRHPAVLFDEAHNNYHKSGGRYKPFADLITNDGYRITPNRQKFTQAVLERYEVLVIANATGAANWMSPEAARSAFTPAECDAVRDWVQGGGALLLIADTSSFGAAAAELAQRLGVHMSKATTVDPANSDGINGTRLLFTRENALLGDHPIIRGRDRSERVDRVHTFTGQSLKGPAGSVALLRLADTAVDRPGAADAVAAAARAGVRKNTDIPAAGRAQGLAFTAGKGRAVVLGEAAMLSAQVQGIPPQRLGMNVPGNDDRQFALNIMHWLTKLTDMEGGGKPSNLAAGGTVARPASSRPATATAAAAVPAPRPPAPASSSVSRGTDRARSTADIVAESDPSIALVKGHDGFGTGFLVAPGVLATNAHVISNDFLPDLEIRFPSAPDGRSGPYPAQLLYEDTKRDLALLAVKTSLPALRVAPGYEFRKGEDITVIGNPGLGGEIVLENAISRGVLSTKTTLDGQSYYQLGISINPGNSGGPVFDSAGRVIGVATLKSAKQEGLAFCIPVDDLRAALEKQAGQSAVETERIVSRHRLIAAVQALSTGGALYCVGLDLRRAAASPAAQVTPAINEAARKFGTIIAERDKESTPGLADQVARVRKDRLVAPSVRDKLGQLSDNFAKLKSAYDGPRPGSLSADGLRQMKQTHRRLATSLVEALKIKLPDGMMSAFDDHLEPQPTVIIGIIPMQPAPQPRIQDRRPGPGGALGPRSRPRPGGTPPSP